MNERMGIGISDMGGRSRDNIDSLIDCRNRYRHLFLENVDRTRDHRGEHEAIQKAIVNRDAETGVTLLQKHYLRTVETLVTNWKVCLVSGRLD